MELANGTGINMQMFDFSIIFVTYHSSFTCIEQNILRHSDKNLEFIIIDNSVNDDYFRSLRLLISRFPVPLQEKIHLVQSPVNGGYTKGINLGFSRARGRFLLLSNPDVLYDFNYFKNAIKLFRHCNWGILGPKLYRNDEKTLYCGLIRFNKHSPFTFMKWLNANKIDTALDNHHYDTFYASGGSLLIRRELFKKLKGLDENLFMYSEETDLCLRAKKLGFKVVYCPELIAIVNQPTSPSLFAQKLIFKNNLQVIGKNYSFSLLLIQFLFSFSRLVIGIIDRPTSYRLRYPRLIPLILSIFQGFLKGLSYH